MTLSDTPGPSLFFTHKDYLERKHYKTTCNFFWCVCTNLSLLVPVIALIGPLNSSAALSFMRKMTDNIGYCITEHHVPSLLSVNHLIWSPILPSKHLLMLKMLGRQFQHSKLYVHTQSGFVFLKLPGAERGSMMVFSLTTSFVRI